MEQPNDIEVDFGEYAEFSVIVEGNKPFDYQWYKNGKVMQEANKSTLVIPSVSESDISTYSVRIKNDFGKAVSRIAELALAVAPRITQQPQSQGVVLGDSAGFEVGASGTEPLDYQWYKDGKTIAGATSSIYQISKVSQDDFGVYSVWAQNKLGRAYSQTVELSLVQLHTLTVASRDPDSGITVTVSPADLKGESDGTTQFARVYSKGTEVTLTAEQSLC